MNFIEIIDLVTYLLALWYHMLDTTLGIKNVSQNTTDETLRAVFGTVGGIKKVSRNVQKGLAFIDMDSEASVAKVMSDVSKFNVCTSILSIHT